MTLETYPNPSMLFALDMIGRRSVERFDSAPQRCEFYGYRWLAIDTDITCYLADLMHAGLIVLVNDRLALTVAGALELVLEAERMRPPAWKLEFYL